jgi:hypothetical protein
MAKIKLVNKEFVKRTEEALKRYEKGEFISKTTEEFLKELDKC